jgi:cell division protein FtsB
MITQQILAPQPEDLTELEKLDNEIRALAKQITKLIAQRDELLAKARVRSVQPGDRF